VGKEYAAEQGQQSPGESLVERLAEQGDPADEFGRQWPFEHLWLSCL
jgi:hypothetical protein